MSTLKTNNIQHVDRSDPSIIINTDGSVNIAGTMTYEDVTNVDAVGIITGRSLINAQKQVHVGTGVSVKSGGINVTAGITTVQALQATTGTFSSGVRIENTAYSAQASGNELIIGTTTGDNGITIASGNSGTGNIYFGDGDSNSIGYMRYDHNSNFLKVNVNGSERLRITSAGRIGIGTVSPDTPFHIYANDAQQITVERSTVANSSIRFRNTIGSMFAGLTSNATGFAIDDDDDLGTAPMFFVNKSDGKIGIGIANPAAKLAIHETSSSSASSQLMRITTANGALFGIETDETVSNPTWKIGGVVNSGAAEPLALYQVGSEILRIDSSGRLLIGTNSSRDNDVFLQLEGLGYQSATMQITRNSNNTDGGGIYIAKTRGTADGQSTIVQDDDELGYINFRGADGTDANTNAATIQAFCDGTPGSNDMPGRLVFSTTADGASSSTERMRIDKHGVIRIGNTDDQATSGSKKRIAIGKRGSLMGYTSGHLNGHIGLIDNYYSDGSSNYIIENGKASFLSLREGSFRFGNSSSSGTAGNVAPGINERIRMDTNGLSFNGDTAAANCLDDYEEGTWTPQTATNTLSYGDARYTKIGRMVYVTAFVNGFSNRTSTNNLQITNLPFTSDGLGDMVGNAIFFKVANTDDGQIGALMTGATSIQFLVSSQGGSENWYYIRYADLNHSTSQIKFSMWYIT